MEEPIQPYFTIGIATAGICFCLCIANRVARRIKTSLNRPTKVDYLLAIESKIERSNAFKNEWYDIFLLFGKDSYEDLARFWQVRQVYEKGRFSVMFSAFLNRIRA